MSSYRDEIASILAICTEVVVRLATLDASWDLLAGISWWRRSRFLNRRSILRSRLFGSFTTPEKVVQ